VVEDFLEQLEKAFGGGYHNFMEYFFLERLQERALGMERLQTKKKLRGEL